MLGSRGCRLGLMYPEIYEMQVRAIARAAIAVRERTGDAPLVEIMHPLVGFEEELRRLRELTVAVAAEEGELDYLVGTMIELPRACIRADEIAAPGRLLLLRHERPHADGARLLARRRRGQVPDALPRGRRARAQPVRGDRRGGRRRADADRGRARPRREGRPEDGHLRRARRRAAVGRVLPPHRARLRVLLALSASRSARLAAAQAVRSTESGVQRRRRGRLAPGRRGRPSGGMHRR